MPASPQRRDSRQRGTRPVDEEYVVFLQGIPPQCRWQELKDLVRQTALHIRQAVVYDDYHGHPTGLGQIIIKNEDEAWHTYNRLSTNGWNGHSLTVTLSLASAPTKPIAGPTKSPSVNRVPYLPFSTPQFGAPVIKPPPSCPLTPDTPMSPTFSPSSDYNNCYGTMSSSYPPQLVSLPPDSVGYPLPYVFPTSGPVMLPSCILQYPQAPFPNISSDGHRGSVSTHSSHSSTSTDIPPTPLSRNIFMQFLAQDTTPAHLREYLKQAGTVEQCEIQERKPIGTRPWIYATARFQTTEAAKWAVTKLDNSMFRGAKIRVRFDREFGRSGDPVAVTPQTILPSPAKSASASPVREKGASKTKKPGTDTSPALKSKNEGDPRSSKSSGEPLVVNGSCVGLKTGRSNLDMFNRGEELSQKTREIRL